MKTTKSVSLSALALIEVLALASVVYLCSSATGPPRRQGTCNRVIYDNDPTRVACKCDELNCDLQWFDWPRQANQVLRVESSKNGSRFNQSIMNLSHQQQQAQNNTVTADVTVSIDTTKHLQQVLGFGGSLSDTSAHLIRLLPDALRAHLLNDYFGQETGSGYTLMRTTIGGSDFSSRPYTLADTPNNIEDFELKYFALQPEDTNDKIPMIAAINKARVESGARKDDVKVFAAPWSPPAWTKANENLVKGTLKPGKKYMDVYARYMVRYLKAYAEHNIRIFSLSPQNEPFMPIRMPDNINFNSLELNPQQFANLVKGSVIPELLNHNYTASKINLLLFDDNLPGFQDYRSALMDSKLVREYARGFAFHWYMHGWRQLVPYSQLYKTYNEIASSLWTLSTEASFIGGPSPGNWTRGASYARDIIENLNAGSVAWIDWNLALNMSGGFTWCDNVLDSAIAVDVDKKFYIKNPMFYAVAHVSRFIKPDSYVVPTRLIKGGELYAEAIKVVSAELPTEDTLSLGGDKSLMRKFATVILNRGTKPLRVKLIVAGCKSTNSSSGEHLLDFELESESISSFAHNC